MKKFERWINFGLKEKFYLHSDGEIHYIIELGESKEYLEFIDDL